METPLESPELQEGKGRTSPTTIIMTIVALIAVCAGLWLLLGTSPRNTPSQPTAVNAPMNPAEEEYAKKLQVGNIAMSRAENFLHQEVTIVNGEVFNGGAEPVAALRLTMEFADDMNQIVLRETRAVLGAPEQPLSPGERRAFEISVEHVPDSWNMRQPTVRVSYLQLSAHK